MASAANQTGFGVSGIKSIGSFYSTVRERTEVGLAQIKNKKPTEQTSEQGANMMQRSEQNNNSHRDAA